MKADVLLLVAAAIWGSGFVAQRIGMDHVGPFTYTATRMAVGVIVLLPFLMLRKREQAGAERGIVSPRVRRWGGLLLGCVLFVGVSFQQVGLIYTTAGKAGFITGLYVVFVPLLGMLLRHRIGVAAWAGVALATAGLYLLSVKPGWGFNRGDGYVLACAVVWAVHLQIIGWLAPRVDGLLLATTQFAVTAVLAALVAVWAEPVTWDSVLAGRWAILYGGVFPVAIAYTLQILAQRHAPPTHAAILLSFEAVFAALIGWAMLSESFSARELGGCALMLGGVMVSQYRSFIRG